MYQPSFYWLLPVSKCKTKLIWKRCIKCIQRGLRNTNGLGEAVGNVFTRFFSHLSPVWCQVNRVEKETIFLFYVHTYSIHLYLYHNLQNQKVEFPMEYLFFNQLVLKCDWNYNVQLL